MLKKVVLFNPPHSQYGVLHAFTAQLSEALKRQGVDSTVVTDVKERQNAFVDELLANPPDCTLSFNGLLPDNEDHFFCDLIKIPHVACLVDAPQHFFPLLRSPLTVVTCIDRSFCDFFRKGKPGKVLFMPHAVDKNLHEEPEKRREFDVVMLSTCIDPEAILRRWKQRYSLEINNLLNESVERIFADQTTSCIEAFTQVLDEHVKKSQSIHPHFLPYEELFDELDTFVKGKDRLELLKVISEDAQVHVFGGGLDGAAWKQFFPSGSKVVVHDPVPLQRAVDIMKNSKVVLNSCASTKNGSHERIFTGLACGAAIVTSENPYMKEEFKEDEGILSYHFKNREAIAPKIARLLKNEEARCNSVRKGYAKVKNHHTWDHRAKMLCESLPSML